MKIWLILTLLLFTAPAWAHKGRHAHKQAHRHAHARKHGHAHRYAHHKRGHKKTRHIAVADAATNQFEQNKGKLLMPVEDALDAAHNRPKPQNFRGELNYGMNIPTALNACVHPVFDGTVSSVFSTTGGNDHIIIVQHGKYYTVYNGLARVLVSKGQHVTPADRIGYVAENEDDCISSLNFQIWKAEAKGLKSKLDPEEWLRR